MVSESINRCVWHIAIAFCFFKVLTSGLASAQSRSALDKPPESYLLKSISQTKNPLVGNWTYRSFRSNPDLSVPVNQLLFGAGVLKFTQPTSDRIAGTLGGEGWELALNGGITHGNPATIRFQGKGKIGTEEWVYDYLGYLVPVWPNSVDQRPAIVGSIVRTAPHSGGQAKAGYVAQWIAVKQDASVPRRPARVESSPRHSGRSALMKAWHEFYTRAPSAVPKIRATESPDVESPLPRPRRKSSALQSTTRFKNPVEISPTSDENVATKHVLETTLTVKYGANTIGGDPVKLRSYGGKLVGPTLRAKPGDTMRIVLRNRLPANTNPPQGNHNSHHNWNTTNLHTHGLHVSPVGNSDNVLLHIEPNQEFEYEINVPDDHPSGTFWYHGHKHGAVAAQVASGMSGALIIEGGLDELPEIKKARELVFVLQQIPYYDDDGNLSVGVIEPEFAVNFFGPGAWQNLKRFTTINGQVQPVIQMQPGEVQRWRFIESGFREKLNLQIQSNADAADKLALHEIAADGLPLGKMVPQDSIELWPGYRSDVLVKAPATSGVYLLVDEESSAGDSLLSEREPKKYLAKIVVTGAAKEMPLPGPASLAKMKKLRLPSVEDDEIDPHRPPQQVTYGIRSNGQGGLLFAINNRAFDTANRRILKRGDTEEWIATSHNPGVPVPVAHPFHIHVNPFEVTSITDANGDNRLPHGKVWRDTIILRDGWTVKFRTRYQRYIGAFVQHCHILDHEDQGMMELIEVVP